jgi:hypothetical protein
MSAPHVLSNSAIFRSLSAILNSRHMSKSESRFPLAQPCAVRHI